MSTFHATGQRLVRQLRRTHSSCGPRHYTTDSPVGLSDPAAYCRDLVRKHDYDSFLMAQFYPKPKQDAYFAIKAFSVSLYVS
jgi:NADH dehydrogenase [ubiquinone] 1 alpha subcomplex assembly factor 6